MHQNARLIASATPRPTIALAAQERLRGLGREFGALALLGLALLSILTGPAFAATDDEFLQPDQAFRISGEAAEADALLVRWDIEPGYYMYKSKFRFASETPGIQTRSADLPTAETKQDEFFGEVQIYRDRVEARIPIERAADAGDIVEIHTTSQGCADAGLCYPPQKQKILLELPRFAAAEQPAAPTPERMPTQSLVAAESVTTSSPGKPALGAMTQSLGLGLEDDILPAEEAFRFSAEVSAPDRLALQWEVAPETYLYEEKIELTLEDADGVQLDSYVLPEAEIKADTVRPDGTIGDVAIYHGTVALDVPLLRGTAEPTTVTLIAKFQGCAERGICYPPVTERVTLELPAALQTVALT
ncbi:MAG: protein-disulfide reductase DsbD N-terminal domain-containing protein, partial [Thiohalocapsa sp.]